MAEATIVGTIHHTDHDKRYMSDGQVLKNAGFGWEEYARVKNGVTPAQAFETAKAVHEKFLNDRPRLAAYRNALHDTCELSKRWKLHAAIGLMPDDPDGVWSEACDGLGENVSMTIDEVSSLCRLYRSAIAEAEESRKSKAQ